MRLLCAWFLKLSRVLSNNFCPICSTNLVHTSLEASLNFSNLGAQLGFLLSNKGVYSQVQLCFLENKMFFQKEDIFQPVLQNEKKYLALWKQKGLFLSCVMEHILYSKEYWMQKRKLSSLWSTWSFQINFACRFTNG